MSKTESKLPRSIHPCTLKSSRSPIHNLVQYVEMTTTKISYCFAMAVTRLTTHTVWDWTPFRSDTGSAILARLSVRSTRILRTYQVKGDRTTGRIGVHAVRPGGSEVRAKHIILIGSVSGSQSGRDSTWTWTPLSMTNNNDAPLSAAIFMSGGVEIG